MLYNIIFLKSFIFFYISHDNMTVTVKVVTFMYNVTLNLNSRYQNKKIK